MEKREFFVMLAFLPFMGFSARINNEKMKAPDVSLIEISQQLLYAAKTRTPTDSLSGVLSKFSPDDLEMQLTSDDQKKAFWINVYNAYTQIILFRDPDRYKKRSSFFGSRQIPVAGRLFSLDEIEHGILRHSRLKWSLGYLGKIFPSGFEKKNRVSHIDYRIHFSLNCGAKSCPPIAFYKPEQLDKQLDIATNVYLKGESEYQEGKNRVYVPALMGWFRGDFGGKSGIKTLLKKTGIIPEESNPYIHFKKYNWDLFLANYKNE